MTEAAGPAAVPTLPVARTRGLHHVEHCMGTAFSFDIRDPVTPAVGRALGEAVAWLHHVDEVFSTYRPDSAISRLAREETTLAHCPPEVAEVFELCDDAARITRGGFSRTPDGRLDPSGLVKGWAVERASQILYAAGAHNTYVNGGGDLQLRGEAAPGTPWRVGIADPLRQGRLLTVVTGRDGVDGLAIATSGTAERGHHIIDPRTGAPAFGLLSVTVTGRHLTQADAYATAAFADGAPARDWITTLEGYELLTVTPEGDTWHTAGFHAPPRARRGGRE